MLKIITLLCLVLCEIHAAGKPHLILIVADDMGWNDVGFHGSSQIPTPNIDALAYNGVILNKLYTQATCTPSRAALLTGQYPLRMGLQGEPTLAGENRYIPLNVATLPERLKPLGYSTHIVGKWHLGFACEKYTAVRRGFDQHFGYWNGYTGYYNYTLNDGYDLHHNLDPAWQYNNTYATDIFTRKSVDIIQSHNRRDPLFLMVAHLAAHTGYDGVALEVPDINYTNRRYGYIAEEKRRRYADMVNRLDDSVGKIMKALSERNMLENSVVVFLSDNGAPTIGLMENAASNWPLKGLKATLFEGGVRVAAAVYSPLLKYKGYINNQLMHITDLFATFYSLAGGTNLRGIDGVDQWNTISQNKKSQRDEIVLDIDEIENHRGIIGLNGRFKFVNGSYDNDIYKHLGESGRTPGIPNYDLNAILSSDVSKAIASSFHSNLLTGAFINRQRLKADTLNCNYNRQPEVTCDRGCLFDLEQDPCEYENVISNFPNIARQLKARLNIFEQQLVPQGDRFTDPRADPLNFDGYWSPWLEALDECS